MALVPSILGAVIIVFLNQCYFHVRNPKVKEQIPWTNWQNGNRLSQFSGIMSGSMVHFARLSARTSRCQQKPLTLTGCQKSGLAIWGWDWALLVVWFFFIYLLAIFSLPKRQMISKNQSRELALSRKAVEKNNFPRQPIEKHRLKDVYVRPFLKVDNQRLVQIFKQKCLIIGTHWSTSQSGEGNSTTGTQRGLWHAN